MASQKPNNNPFVLLAEDDEDDKELIRIAFQKALTEHKLHIADNGLEALNYLLQLSHEKSPCLIVLDLNMPVMDGMQTLEALNQMPEFRTIPKIIFTTSDSDDDKKRSLSNGAVDYLVKPSSMSAIVKSIESMMRHCKSSYLI